VRFLTLLLIYYLTACIVTLIAYAIDKSAARQGNRRISEKTLQLMALFGGWPGALLAQQWLRHKTQKQSFRLVFWAMVLVNVFVVVVLAYYFF